MKLSTLIYSVILLLIFCSHSGAEDLVELTRNASWTVTYYIDKDSIHSAGNKITFWDKREVSDDPDFTEIRGYLEVDCVENNYRTIQIIGYGKNGDSSKYEDAGQCQKIDVTSAISVYHGYLCKK